MHPAEKTWQEMLDGEVDPPILAELERHLLECEECRRDLAALQRARDEVTARLNELVSPVPTPRIEVVLRRGRRQVSRRWALVAASLALTVVTVAGATIHYGLIPRLIERVRGNRPPPVSRETSSPKTRPETMAPSGIALEPVGAADIVFEDTQPVGDISVKLVDGPRVSIRASSTLQYTVKPASVTVANRGATASYEIDLPRSLERATIRVGDRVVLAKRGSSIITAARIDSTGSYVLPFPLQERSSP